MRHRTGMKMMMIRVRRRTKRTTRAKDLKTDGLMRAAKKIKGKVL